MQLELHRANQTDIHANILSRNAGSLAGQNRNHQLTWNYRTAVHCDLALRRTLLRLL